MIKSWVTPASIAIKKGLKKHAHKFPDGPNEEAFEYIDLLYTYKEASEATKRAQGDCIEAEDAEETDEEEDSGEQDGEDVNTSSSEEREPQ